MLLKYSTLGPVQSFHPNELLQRLITYCMPYFKPGANVIEMALVKMNNEYRFFLAFGRICANIQYKLDVPNYLALDTNGLPDIFEIGSEEINISKADAEKYGPKPYTEWLMNPVKKYINAINSYIAELKAFKKDTKQTPEIPKRHEALMNKYKRKLDILIEANDQMMTDGVDFDSTSNEGTVSVSFE